MIKWNKITTSDTEPNYYHNVMIVANGKIYYEFHRLSNGDDIYYGSLNTDKIIYANEVTHWAELPQLPTE